MTDRAGRGPRRRITLVAADYWPHRDRDVSYLAGDVARRLADEFHVRVASTRRRRGPTRHIHDALEVTRVLRPVRSEWSIARYIRAWVSHLIDHHADADAIVAVGAREEAHAAVEAARALGLPSVVYTSGDPGDDDLAHWHRRRARTRHALCFRRATTVVAPCESTRRQLSDLGFAAERLGVRPLIPPVDSRAQPTNGDSRKIARKILGIANGDLRSDPDTPIWVTDSPMVRGGVLEHLLPHLHGLFSRHPEVRWWWLGDGPARDRLHTALRREGVRNAVSMPGTFTELTDVLAAADAMIHLDPCPRPGLLAHAAAAGVPIVAAATPDNRESLGDAGARVRWVESVDPVSMSHRMLDDIFVASASDGTRKALGSSSHFDVDVMRGVLGDRAIGDRRPDSPVAAGGTS